jgi:hypothetical protein
LLDNADESCLFAEDLIFRGKLSDLLFGVFVKFVLLTIPMMPIWLSCCWLQKLVDSFLSSELEQVAIPLASSILNLFFFIIDNIICNWNDFNELVHEVSLLNRLLGCWIECTLEYAAELLFELVDLHDSVLLDILISEHLAEVIHL